MHAIGIFLLVLSFPLFGQVKLTTQIHDIDYGKKPGDEVLVLLESGHVAKVRDQKSDMMTRLVRAKTNDEWYTFSLDKNRYLIDIKSAPPAVAEIKRESAEEIMSDFVPTTIASMEIAKKYHREARHASKEETQCFNRALIWSYEWWKNHSLKSGKLLIFFTRNYIRRYDFEWWFHIAPYVHILEGDKVVERTMDAKYTRGPLEFGKWTNIFMRNDAPCPIITKYSQYADHPYVGECYLMRADMYTYQPADLQMYEAWGYRKHKFKMDEVKAAYLEAFSISL